MTALIKKIHMYLGLLSLTILLVFGIIGTAETFMPAYENRPRPTPQVSYENFTVPANQTDEQVLHGAWESLKLPMTSPPPRFTIRRDGDKNLTTTFYTPNGYTRVTVLEKENRLKLEDHRNSWVQYFNSLHATTIRHPARDLRITLWKLYNEFSVWTLILMSVTGPYLWLASRPGHRWAQIFFGAGTGSFLVLYLVSR